MTLLCCWPDIFAGTWIYGIFALTFVYLSIAELASSYVHPINFHNPTKLTRM